MCAAWFLSYSWQGQQKYATLQVHQSGSELLSIQKLSSQAAGIAGVLVVAKRLRWDREDLRSYIPYQATGKLVTWLRKKTEDTV
jgi:hypothetical protein